MKLLVVSESYWPNLDGGAVFQRELAHGIAKQGHDVVIWAPGPNFQRQIEYDGSTKIYRERSVPVIGDPRYRFSLWPYTQAFRLLRSEKPDVVHIHTPFQSGLAALIAAKWLRIPVVATNHIMPENILSATLPRPVFQTLSFIIWQLITNVHNRANFVTTPSPIALAYLYKKKLIPPAEVVSNGLNTSFYVPGNDNQNIKPVLLYVGRHDKEKNLPIILEAVARVLKTAPLHLEMVGSGNRLDALKQQAQQLGIASSVTFRGRVSERQKLQAYQSADIFIIMSKAELQSIVTMEAMATGLPILAANAGALPDLVSDGVNGYLVNPDSAEQLADRITLLLSNRPLRKKFGIESRSRIQDKHSTEQMLGTYLRIYRQLTGL